MGTFTLLLLSFAIILFVMISLAAAYVFYYPLKIREHYISEQYYIYANASPERKNQKILLKQIYNSLTKEQLQKVKGIGIYKTNKNHKGKWSAEHMPSKIGCIIHDLTPNRLQMIRDPFEIGNIAKGDYFQISIPYNLLAPWIGALRVHRRLSQKEAKRNINDPIIEIVDAHNSRITYLKAKPVVLKEKAQKKEPTIERLDAVLQS